MIQYFHFQIRIKFKKKKDYPGLYARYKNLHHQGHQQLGSVFFFLHLTPFFFLSLTASPARDSLVLRSVLGLVTWLYPTAEQSRVPMAIDYALDACRRVP